MRLSDRPSEPASSRRKAEEDQNQALEQGRGGHLFPPLLLLSPKSLNFRVRPWWAPNLAPLLTSLMACTNQFISLSPCILKAKPNLEFLLFPSSLPVNCPPHLHHFFT